MAVQLLMRRVEGTKFHLAPVDELGREAIAALPYDAEFSIKVTMPRSSKHHRLFFALMNEVYKNQKTFSSMEGMLDAIKIAIGHCDERIAVTGTKFYVPRSISFANMDQIEFREFYNKAVDVILNHILPHTNRADLEQRVYDILGEPGPSSIR